jgi:hypothetical protein
VVILTVMGPEKTREEGVGPRGRSCPLAYRYQPEALAQPAQLEADTLYVVGGLYGNPAALAVPFDLDAWTARFLAQWPPGSPAHRAYFGRITGGTHLRLEQATRGVELGSHFH